MNVTVVCDVLGSENNGTTIAAMNLIRALKDKGHHVNVVCPDTDRQGESGFYVTPKMHFGRFIDKYVEKNGVVIAKKDRNVLLQAMENADVVHVMMPFSLGKAAARIAKEKGIALTAGFHCQAENVTGHLFLQSFHLASRVAYRVFYRRLYRHCDRIHYPTQFIRDTFERVVGSTPGQVISNGVGSRFKPLPAAPGREDRHYTLLFTGRYSPEKSHAVLIRALAKSRHRDEIDLILAGSGPREKAIRRLARRKGLKEPTMRFFSREEMLDVLARTDLYVHPAEIEIESIACLEAIACGRVPLIADSPRSASRYFALSEKNLFVYNDPGDLAAKIDWWLEHPEEKEKCAAQYAGYAEQFNFDRCMDEMERLLLGAAEAKKHVS